MYREERGRKGDREGGKLQGMYPGEDTGQYTVYIAQNTHNNLDTLVFEMKNSEQV